MTSKPTEAEKIRATIAHLRLCQRARTAGYQVSYTTDPAWLVEVAINRRAGWPDDPTVSRGSCMPVGGRYPRKAEGDNERHLQQISHRVNTPRLIVRPAELGEWRPLLMARIPERFTIGE